jgi:hypothetical protein
MSRTSATYWKPLSEDQRHRWRWLEGLEGQVEEVILSRDRSTGGFTRLTRFHPGADVGRATSVKRVASFTCGDPPRQLVETYRVKGPQGP